MNEFNKKYTNVIMISAYSQNTDLISCVEWVTLREWLSDRLRQVDHYFIKDFGKFFIIHIVDNNYIENELCSIDFERLWNQFTQFYKNGCLV